MNLFDSLRTFAGKWSVKSSRAFNADEISAVSNATIVDSQYGKSVCFHMKAGGTKYIPLSTESNLSVGSTIDMDTAKVVTLSKDGESDILRVEA